MRKSFFDGLIRTSHTWVGHIGNSQIPVKIRLLPLLDDTESQTINHSRTGLTLHAIIHKDTVGMAACVTNPHSDHAAHFISMQRHMSHLLAVESGKTPFVVIDPLKKVWSIVDRRDIFKAVDYVFKSSRPCSPKRVSSEDLYPVDDPFVNVSSAGWVEVPMNKGLSAVRQVVAEHLKFPIILKRRLSCGSKESHEMVIAYNMEGLVSAARTVFHVDESEESPDQQRDFICNIIAQEYISNHGGVIFKVYAVGSHVVVQARSSVNNISENSRTGYHHFDSQRLNQGGHYLFDSATGRSKSTDAIMPSQKLASSTVSALSKYLGLTLLGVDLIYDVQRKKYYVVDINYFPGYKGVDEAYEWILQHICNCVKEERDQP